MRHPIEICGIKFFQAEIVRKYRLPQGNVSAILSGKRKPSPRELAGLSDFFHISPEQLPAVLEEHARKAQRHAATAATRKKKYTKQRNLKRLQALQPPVETTARRETGRVLPR